MYHSAEGKWEKDFSFIRNGGNVKPGPEKHAGRKLLKNKMGLLVVTCSRIVSDGIECALS